MLLDLYFHHEFRPAPVISARKPKPWHPVPRENDEALILLDLA